MLSPRNFTWFFCCIFISCNAVAQTETTPEYDSGQCRIPTYANISLPDQRITDGTIIISSKQSQIEKNQVATFSGGVTLTNKSHTISADKVEINREKSLINAQGDIHFQNKGIDIFASQLSASESSKATSLRNASYQIANNPGHGSAADISVSSEGKLTLSDSSFTTCYGLTPDWLMQASEINISSENKQLEAYHARFSVFDVPLLYVPYISLPIGNERQSGFLYPSFKSTSLSGFEMKFPYYWNIAENIDATITPRYMSKRGLQLTTEFRYLSELQNGILNLEYLNKDEELKTNNDPRYLARLQHIGTFSDHFRAYIDYTTISDDNYLVDLTSSQYNANDAYLYQIGELAYFATTWQAKLQLQNFEVLGNHLNSYKTEPHIELSSQQKLPFMNGLFDLYSELTRFTTTEQDLPEAERYHFEAGVTLPIATPAWFINSEVRLLQTNYHQKNIQSSGALKANVSRTLSKIRVHGGMNFDREMPYFEQNYVQTLEPQLQYLYIPNKDQSAIGLYDTTTLQDDYTGLFRDRRFSGIDRIAQANQYSWGVTSRILDPDNQEVFRLSLGRIVYLNSSNIAANAHEGISADESALATEIYLRLNRKWEFSSDIQYNTQTNTTNKSQSKIDYQFSKNQTIGLNHRYTRDVSETSIEQVSLLTNINLNQYWQFVGRITQDIQIMHSVESYIGMQYTSCCWGIRFSFHRHINTNLDEQNFIDENRDTFDSGFKVEFVYNGRSDNQSNSSITDMFNSSIFGYKRPYFLNN